MSPQVRREQGTSDAVSTVPYRSEDLAHDEAKTRPSRVRRGSTAEKGSVSDCSVGPSTTRPGRYRVRPPPGPDELSGPGGPGSPVATYFLS